MAVFLCYGMIQRQESQYKIEKRVYLTYTPISKVILRAIKGTGVLYENSIFNSLKLGRFFSGCFR